VRQDRRTLWTSIALAGFVIFAAGACDGRSQAIYDGFESDSLAPVWDSRKFLPGAVEFQSAVTRAGKGAARITLREGDQIAEERGSLLERAELVESKELWVAEHTRHSYAFSLFLPEDFPVVSTRLVIAQWKQECPIDSCTPDNPTIAIRYVSGQLYITHKVGEQDRVLYRSAGEIRNRWLDFTFSIRFARDASGEIAATLGGNRIIDYVGVNAYPASGGYTADGRFYFKIGLYRDRMPQPMSIYVDEYRKQRL
jgi:hypothetical protein